MGLILAILVMAIASAAVQGQESEGITASEYNVKYFIAYDRVVGDYEAKFSEPVSGKIIYELPYDAKGILMYVDDEEVEPKLVGNRLVIELEENTKFRTEYLSKIEVAGNELVTTVQFPFNAEKISVETSLPSGARLTEPVKEGSSRSVFPKPKHMYTDGQNIDIAWEYSNKEIGEDIPILVKFKIPSNTWIYLLIIGLVLVIAAMGAGILMLSRRAKRNERPRIVVKRVVEKVESGGGYEEHLKEDEQQVVNILKMKEGSCDQG
ncbi:TPA: hypothetical protein HA265_00755, partial [Candidatus Woesearchaeota archaeon]|nr:hypothetical protein [Candidatus Woesearchaeota archaeon]